MPLTEEQEMIAASSAQILKVNARAGSGKTFVLEEYANRRPRTQMLYLAYNRSIKEEAVKRFPKNVRCLSTHGLAFPKFGAMYQHKLKIGAPRASHVAKLLKCDLVSAGLVLNTLNNWIISADRRISAGHAIAAAPNATPTVIQELASRAERVWAAMLDRDSMDIPFTHDAYLKCYANSNPVIQTDRILFDEAQDANPVTVDIVLRQNAGKTIVGDRHQSIYQFRGAVNALESIRADESLDLTASFRFGSGIADLASGILMDWCGANKPIRGLGKYQTEFYVPQDEPHAIISRTNGSLFSEAVRQILENRPFGFAGGLDANRFDLILDTYHLYSGSRFRVRDQFLASFEDFALLKKYGDEIDDKEIKVLVRVVEEYGHDIPRLVAEIKSRALPNLDHAHVILATAHKSKGMEFDNVILSEDYTDLVCKKDPETGQDVPPKESEVNVLYVAMTRARRRLSVPYVITEWLAETGRTKLLAQIKSASRKARVPAPESEHALNEKMAQITQIIQSAKGAKTDPGTMSRLAEFLRSTADALPTR